LLWYGLIYYSWSLFSFYFLLSHLVRIVYYFSKDRLSLFHIILSFMLSFFIFFSFTSFTSLYNLLEFFSNLVCFAIAYVVYFENEMLSAFFNFLNLNLNLLSIYYFPFVYIFVLVTVLSILFCLAYNINELLIFIFYCTVIIIAGYMLFFTDSLVLFFLAYEMLLVPSFFILYKFAKTRRCVEASYLMFFWTQFGALMLIFSFLYLFSIARSSSFQILNFYEFSSFEINFLFICWIAGFGVKLPVWPFYGWLPKAHVEASTNFSIFLSGVLVKFAFFGLLKCLTILQLEPTVFYV
jgi:formate hydrogenlyase subunit 3/multisubunit Na+/H+ antiporter MnhD subunit